MSSTYAGSSGVSGTLRLKSRDTANGDSYNILMRIDISSLSTGSSVMVKGVSRDSP